jgi:hypothetical protein
LTPGDSSGNKPQIGEIDELKQVCLAAVRLDSANARRENKHVRALPNLFASFDDKIELGKSSSIEARMHSVCCAVSIVAHIVELE